MNSLDTRWVLLEENYPFIVLLTEEEALFMKKKFETLFPKLNYTLFYDEYYEFSEIIYEN